MKSTLQEPSLEAIERIMIEFWRPPPEVPRSVAAPGRGATETMDEAPRAMIQRRKENTMQGEFGGASDQRTENNAPRHQCRAPGAVEKARVDNVKRLARQLMDCLGGLPPGREASIAKTKLEESVMWAVKGLTG